jgi:hypothetical protein
VSKGKGNGNGARPDRPGDAMLELAAEIQRDDGEWDNWDEEDSTVRTLIVDHRHAPAPPREKEPSIAGVAQTAVDKLPPSHLLIVVLVVALAAALVGGHKLGLW